MFKMHLFNNGAANNSISDDNKGFSLVEVLIAVFVLAIVFTPVMKSFMMGAMTNSRAQEIQNATSLAETVMEEVKTTSIRELSDSGNMPHFTSAESTKEFKANRQEIQTQIDGTKTKTTPVETTNPPLSDFDAENVNIMPPYIIEYKNVTATQGRKYDVLVTIQPDEYSNPVTPPAPGSSSSEIKVDTTNNIELPQFSEIETSQNAVISWEINRHDGVAFEALLDKNVENTTGGYGSTNRDKPWWPSIGRLHDHGRKIVTITIDDVKDEDDNATDDRFVKCVVEYDPNIDESLGYGKYERISHSVYYAEFAKSEMQDIYIFYTLMKDDAEALIRQKGAPNYDFSLHEEYLKIEDKANYGSTGRKPDIYFVLQKYTDTSSSVTFNAASDSIQVVSSSSPSVTLTLKDVIKDGTTGDLSVHGHNMYTNFKYVNVSEGVARWEHGDLFSTSKKDKVYTATVEVRKAGDESGDPIATISSTINAGAEASEKD